MNGWTKTLAAALLGCAALQAGSTTLNVTPVPNPSYVGQVVTLNVSLSDVQWMSGYHFSVGFDPAVVQASSVEVETIYGTAGNALYTQGGIDNNAGEVVWISAGTYNGVLFTGSAQLARITFTAVGTGNANVALKDIELYDPGSNDIPFTLNATPLQVNAIAAVPEPSAWLMLGAGLAGIAAWRRRKAC
jgi:hypothetical protein